MIMINNQRVLCLIPARGGSKAVPKKNIKLLAGKPLIAWSIELAKKINEIDRVIVSTDDEVIASVALASGAEVYTRPDNLATDNSLIIDAIRDLLKKLREEGENAGIVILLEPTSPLRSSSDVLDCLNLLVNERYDSVATFKSADLNPYRAWKVFNGVPEVFIEGANPWVPRQMLPPCYQLNGAVYVFLIDKLPTDQPAILFGKKGAILMPAERSIDIDTILDFMVAEEMLKGDIH
jgi:CMP-N,N'-diacetyllegionaminic acid synthase